MAISTSCAALGLAFAGPAQAVTFSCGDIISASGTYVLTADIGTAVTPCVTVFGIGFGADNIVLDLNGHTIWGNGPQVNDTTANIGVYVTQNLVASSNNATVKNGTVTGFNVGVYLEQVSNGTVQSMSLHDNIGPDLDDIYGEGIQVFEGGGHTFTGNSVVHNGPFAGIDLYATPNNTVTNNQVVNNNIILAGGHHGPDPIMQDIGIWVIDLGAQNTVNNNVSTNGVTGNGLDGIQVSNLAHGNFVRTNSVNNNGFGQPATNIFRDGDGIAIFGYSNTVQNNTVNQNGANGIGVESNSAPNGSGNTITGNRALLNGGAPKPGGVDGFDKNVGCDANVWLANIFVTRNQVCVL